MASMPQSKPFDIGICLHLGSNMGDRLHFLQAAYTLVEQDVGVISQQSNIYETEAWGITNQAPFLNIAIETKTKYAPFQLLKKVQDIEKQLGRTRTQRWHARTIDIDILFYNKRIIQTPSLTLPHPRIAQRNFVLVPLCDFAAHWVHPILRKTIDSLRQQCPDKQAVWQYSN